MLTYGSLFSGTGGLDLGVQSVLGGETAWFCEFDKAPSKILAHHWPDVPNLGDITKVDWTQVEPVDVLTGGFPCQDVSHAGRRAGLIRDGEGRTRSGLWGEMLRAIVETKPRLVVAENVRGLLSARADSDMEQCPFCMGDGGGSPMRALGAVLGDLADIGFDAWWYGLRAADVGGAHGRFRVFLFAVPADADDTGLEGLGDTSGAAQAGRHGHTESGAGGPDLTLLPTPTSSDTNGPGAHGDGGADLPTPVSDNSRGLPSSGTDYASLPNAVVSLLPTPSVADVMGGRKHRSGERSDELLLNGIAHHDRWGDYAAAIARWEHVIGRAAPPPTETGAKGNPRLSPKFCEWLMGLPEGHVTSEDIGITRNEMLRALGNGVVPTQAAAATRAFISDTSRGA